MEAEVTGAFISGILGLAGSIGAAYVGLQGKNDIKEQQENIQLILLGQKGIVLDLKTLFQDVARSINDPKQRQKIEDHLQKLDARSREIQEISEDFKIWKEASLWLDKNKEIIGKRAVEDVLKEYDWLTKPGRALDSQEKIQKFTESIELHIQWIWANLSYGTNVPFEMTRLKFISDNDVYKKAFESIKANIAELQNQKARIRLGEIFGNNNKIIKLSKPSAKILTDFLVFLIEEYS